MSKLPQIYKYDDYRLFLKDYYTLRKEIDPTFSFRSFASEAGFQSSPTLKRVMEGSRNISLKGIEKFAKGLKFKPDEKTFFKNLVLFNQAKTPMEKEHFAQEILKSRAHRNLKPLAKHQYDFWTGWHHIVVREMVGMKQFKEDPDWIGKKIIPIVPAEKIKKSIKKLERLKMIYRDDQGKLQQSNSYMTTGDQVVYSSLRKFHRQMIDLGKESIDRFSNEDRQVSSLTLCLTKEQSEKIRVLINQFRKDILAFSQEENHGDRIYQINFQIFPLTESLKKEST